MAMYSPTVSQTSSIASAASWPEVSTPRPSRVTVERRSSSETFEPSTSATRIPCTPSLDGRRCHGDGGTGLRGFSHEPIPPGAGPGGGGRGDERACDRLPVPRDYLAVRDRLD